MAMIYPFILLGVAVAVIVALMVFVVPELIGIFAHSNRELPPLTRALIATRISFAPMRCGCAWRWCSQHRLPAPAARAGAAAPLARAAAARAGTGGAAGGDRYGALCLHPEYPHGQRRAPAGIAAYRRGRC
jgi:hypothetical protein